MRARTIEVSLCLHVCARLYVPLYIKKKKKGWAIFTSRPPLHQPNLPPTHSFIPLCRQPHLLCWAQAVSVQSSPSIPPAHVSCSALRFFFRAEFQTSLPPPPRLLAPPAMYQALARKAQAKWWREMTWTPLIPSLVLVIGRSSLKGRLSQCCGRYLKLSVLSPPQRESWGRSSRWRFWRHRCSTTSQQVGYSVCEREHVCMCVRARVHLLYVISLLTTSCVTLHARCFLSWLF